MTASASLRQGFKVLTHDHRPPLQGGAALWDGTSLPHTLPTVTLDTSARECGHGGWHYCASLSTAARIAGLWPTGRPSVAFEVLAADDAVERGDKRRASSLTLLRVCTEDEWREAITEMSAPFGARRAALAEEQMRWRTALTRPRRDVTAVEAGLRAALDRRGLSTWSLQRFDTAGAAWAAWDLVKLMLQTQDRWRRHARAAWDAWDALTVNFAACQGWVTHPPDLLSHGLLDAYSAGLLFAVPVAARVLGWAMDGEEETRP